MPVCMKCEKDMAVDRFDIRANGMRKKWCQDCCTEAAGIARDNANRRHSNREKKAAKRQRQAVAYEKHLTDRFGPEKAAEMILRNTRKRTGSKKKLGAGKAGTGYHSRNSYLRNMGFPDYAAYLRSDLWRDIRRRVLEEKGSKCFTCGSQAKALHHLRYHHDDLCGNTLENIVPVCDCCHHEFEFTLSDKATVSEAKAAYQKKREVYLAQNAQGLTGTLR